MGKGDRMLCNLELGGCLACVKNIEEEKIEGRWRKKETDPIEALGRVSYFTLRHKAIKM